MRTPPREAVLYELAREWHTTPWELKRQPASEVRLLLEMHNLEAVHGG